MLSRIAVLSVCLVCLASADTLKLRDGRTITGTYVGGSARQVRMLVGDNVQSFDVTDVASVEFGESASMAATAAATPAISVPPAETQPSAAPRQRVPMTRPEAAITTAPAAPAAATRPLGPYDVPAGTQITVRMIDDVDSQNAEVGQTFRASVDDPVIVNGRTVIPRGADVLAKLVQVQDPNRITGGGQLTLDLASVQVNGRMVDVESEAVQQQGESRTGSSAKVIGGTAALGAIIGAIAGGGKGAAIGAVSGAGAGTAIQVLTSGARVRVPSETRLTFTLQTPLRVS